MQNFNDDEFCAILEASGYNRQPNKNTYDNFYTQISNFRFIYWNEDGDIIHYKSNKNYESLGCNKSNWRKLESFIGEQFVIPEQFNFHDELNKIGLNDDGGNEQAFYFIENGAALIERIDYAITEWHLLLHNGISIIQPTPENLEQIKIALNALKELK